MLGAPERQMTVLDQMMYSYLLPQDHLLLRIDQMVDFGPIRKKLERFYHPVLGRPSYPPEMLVRVLFLAYLYDLSDVAVCEQLRYNALFRWFCHIGVEDPIPDDTTLVKFRARLKEEGFSDVLAEIVEQAREKGVLKERIKLVDSTKVVADVAAQNTYGLLRQGRRLIMRALKRHDPARAEQLSSFDPDREKTQEREGQSVAYQERLQQEMEVAKELLSRLGEEVPEPVKGVVEQYRAVTEGRAEIGSFHDTDARWGHTAKDKPFFGYKVHASCDESGVVTSIEVTPGNEPDGGKLPGLVEQDEKKEVSAQGLAADKAYDCAANHKLLRDKQMRDYIPRRWEGKKALSRFRYDRDQQVLSCPGGKESIGCTPHQNGGMMFYFSQSHCSVCPLRGECLAPGQERKVVYVGPTDMMRFDGRVKLSLGRKARSIIERVFGEAKKWHGLGRARYRELWRVYVQAAITFAIMNVKKIVTLAKTRGKVCPRAA